MPVSISINSSSSTVCTGTPVTFTSTVINPGTNPVYVWKVNDVARGGNFPGFTYIPVNNDVVTCLVTSNVNCPIGNPATSNAILLKVNPLVTVDVTVSASANPVCGGIPVTFTGFPVNGGISPVFQWKVNGLNFGTNSSAYTYNPANGDIVNCILTSSFLNCTLNNPATSNSITMAISSSPVVNFTSCYDTVTSLNAKPFLLKGGIPLGGTYSGPGVNSSTSYFSPSLAGTGLKSISYTYRNQALCSDMKTRSILVQAAPAFTCGQPLVDIRDMKSYPTVLLGTQCWMRNNLDFGSFISGTSPQQDNCKTEKYCYNDEVSNCTVYGGLYQWDELMQYQAAPSSQGICPPGWHIPTQSEWMTLFTFYQEQALAGKPLQDTIIVGFRAKESGVIYSNFSWSLKGFASIFWTSTPSGAIKAISHGMNLINFSVSDYHANRSNAFGVRCLRD